MLSHGHAAPTLYGVRMLWCTQTARDRLPSTPRRYQAVAEATTDTQLASDEVTELAVADLETLVEDHPTGCSATV